LFNNTVYKVVDVHVWFVTTCTTPLCAIIITILNRTVGVKLRIG